MKKINKWVAHELTTNQKKKKIIEVSSSTQQQQTISWSGCDVWWKVDFIWQPAMTCSVVGPKRSSKALPKAKLVLEKGHGHYLVVCCLSDPLQLWVPAKPLHLSSLLSKSMRCTENCTCSWRWLKERAQFSHVTQPMLQKLKELGYEALLRPPCLPDLSPTDCHFFKHINNILQGKHFHNQQEAENAFHEFIKSWSTDLYALQKWTNLL